jgi:hypothetical protein
MTAIDGSNLPIAMDEQHKLAPPSTVITEHDKNNTTSADEEIENIKPQANATYKQLHQATTLKTQSARNLLTTDALSAPHSSLVNSGIREQSYSSISDLDDSYAHNAKIWNQEGYIFKRLFAIFANMCVADRQANQHEPRRGAERVTVREQSQQSTQQ